MQCFADIVFGGQKNAIKCLQPKGAGAEGEAEKSVQEHAEVMEGGAVKPGQASDPKQPKENVGVLQGGGADHPAKAGDTGADIGLPKAPAQAPYKEDSHVVAGGDSQSQLGARGVPLGKKRLDDQQPEPPKAVAAQPAEGDQDKGKEKIENLVKEQLDRDVQARLEKEQVEREIREKVARKQELERLEQERIKEEVQARLDKERLEREKKELLARQELEKERAEKERIEREVQAELEKERLEKERAAKEKAAEEKLQQENHKADNEILEKAVKGKNGEAAQAELAKEDGNVGKAVQEAEREDGKALKKGGRDLKENVAAQADPREGVQDRPVKAEAHPQGSHEKGRDQGDTDLRRRRRALGPGEAGGPPEENGGVPGLEPLLALGGSNLHAALEEQLLAGAMVHSRQIKQVSKDEGKK